MKFSVDRESLLRPIQQVSGVVERRQALPILQNLLLEIQNGKLLITGTDLEIELKTNVEVSAEEEGLVTVPARKLFDICKEIPDQAKIDFSLKQNRLELNRVVFVLRYQLCLPMIFRRSMRVSLI